MNKGGPTADTSPCEWPRVFCCRLCDAPLGSTEGLRLTVGAVIFSEPLRPTCVACREPYEWKPDVKEGLADGESPARLEAS